MRLKSILARNMPDGMRRMREQLGEGAIIVRTQESDGGVLITAAVDDAVTPPPAPVSGKTHDPWAEPVPDLSEALSEALDRHHLPPRLAGALVAAAEGTGADDPVAALAGALQARFRFDPLSTAAVMRPLLFTGPPGSGKTVTLAKLAAQAVLEDRQVTVISADTGRAGALEQLGAFLAVLGLDLHRAADAAALSAVIPAGAGRLVLIDAPAANPFDPATLTATRDLAAAADAEPILILAAGLDPAEAGDTAAAFAQQGVRRLVATRLDAARRLGGLFAAANRGRLAFAQTAASRQIADALHPMDPRTLAALLLKEKASMLASPRADREERTAK